MFDFQSKDHKGLENKLCKINFKLLKFIILSVFPDTRGGATHGSQEHRNSNWNFKTGKTMSWKQKNFSKSVLKYHVLARKLELR